MSFKYPLQKNQSLGSVTDGRDYHWKWIGPDGEDWGTSDYVTPPAYVAYGSRAPQSSNQPYPIGKGRFFRPISDWRRGGVRVGYLSGQVEYRGWGKYYNPNTGQLEDRRDRQIYSGNAFDRNGFYGSPYIPYPLIGSWGELNAQYDPNMRTRVLTELLLKVGGRKTSYGEALGESRQTINHLAKTTSSVVKALLAARKGRWGDVAKALGVHKRQLDKGASPWADRWLEYQYGWLPLLGDIADTTELIKKGFREETQLMSSVRQIKDPVPPRKTSQGFEFTPPTGDGLLTYRGKVYYRVNDSSLSRLNQIGLINPIEVAWALVPYSFVVDWFIPVGNFLEALMAPVGVDFIDGYYSISFEGRYTTHNRPAEIVGPGWWHEPVGEFRIESEISSYYREKLNSFPTPGLYYKSPFSTTHVTSAVALLRQLLR